jgi:hypothetical protein
MGKPPRNPNRPMPLAVHVPGLLAKAYERHGFAQGQVLAHWAEIVGAELAAFTRPERIRWPRSPAAAETRPGRLTGGTLVVRVDGPAAIELQHSTPQIIDRINGFYGFGAIVALKIVQGPIPRRERARPRVPDRLDDAREARIADRVAGVADERLRATLSKLGRGIMFAKK